MVGGLLGSTVKTCFSVQRNADGYIQRRSDEFHSFSTSCCSHWKYGNYFHEPSFLMLMGSELKPQNGVFCVMFADFLGVLVELDGTQFLWSRARERVLCTRTDLGFVHSARLQACQLD